MMRALALRVCVKASECALIEASASGSLEDDAMMSSAESAEATADGTESVCDWVMSR